MMQMKIKNISDVKEMLELRKTGLSCMKISSRYNISHETVRVLTNNLATEEDMFLIKKNRKTRGKKNETK